MPVTAFADVFFRFIELVIELSVALKREAHVCECCNIFFCFMPFVTFLQLIFCSQFDTLNIRNPLLYGK